MIMPVSSLCFKASRGQAVTQGAGLHNLQATEIFTSGCKRSVRILDFWELNAFSLVKLQMYSHTPQPVHFSGSQETIFHFALSLFGVDFSVFAAIANFRLLMPSPLIFHSGLDTLNLPCRFS
jgi:hypothetical protein